MLNGHWNRKLPSCYGHCKGKFNFGSMATFVDRLHCSCMASSLINNLFSLSYKNVWYTPYIALVPIVYRQVLFDVR